MTLMDSSFLGVVLCLMLAVAGQDDLPIASAAAAAAGALETQYLTFEMSQYGPEGGVFSSRLTLSLSLSLTLVAV